MQDPKFEKEVQKKLEELSFSPSDAVWTRVERAVNEDRRRRVPLFWFFLLPALGLAGAGMIYFSKARTDVAKKGRADVAIHQAGSGKAIPAARGASTTGTATGSTPVASEAITPVKQGETSTVTSGATRPKTSGETRPRTAGETGITSFKGAGPVTAGATRITSSKGAGPVTSRGRKPTIFGETGTVTSGEKVSMTSGQTEPTPFAATGTEEKRPATSVAPGTKERRTDLTHAGLPGLKTFDRHFAPPAASHLSTTSASTAAAKTPIQLKRRYSWEAGFAGGVGVSSLNNALFQQPVVMSNLTPSLSAITSSPKDYSSAVQPGLSYWAGIVAQRPLSKALTLSLGLDLHYYSSRVQIGDKVYNDPSSLYSASSLFNTNQTTRAIQSPVYPYYSVGSQDVYTNHYYFLEMPVSVLWQVTHIRRLPVFWESGISLSYLFSSNSLYYNAKSGVFYKAGGDMINKTQFNLATAVLVGLPVKGVRLQVGPQVQYGITSLQNLGTSGQHLFYGGLRVVLLPGKVKK